MKRLLLALTLITLPSIASAQIAIQDDYAIQGKIFAVKTAKKYSSVEGCSKIALSKTKVAGFTFESKSQKFNDVTNIPKWVKNNAEWWADGIIDDESFMSGIEYLVKEEIIQID